MGFTLCVCTYNAWVNSIYVCNWITHICNKGWKYMTQKKKEKVRGKDGEKTLERKSRKPKYPQHYFWEISKWVIEGPKRAKIRFIPMCIHRKQILLWTLNESLTDSFSEYPDHEKRSAVSHGGCHALWVIYIDMGLICMSQAWLGKNILYWHFQLKMRKWSEPFL